MQTDKSVPADAGRDAAGGVAPLHKSVKVACDVDHAFRVFTDRIATWWPLASHSVGQADAEKVALEARVGGRLYETVAGGEEHTWGTVTRWDPPRGLAFTWHPGREPDSAQQIEVTFSAEGGGARVDLVHSGWDILGEKAAETRRGYDTGWDLVLVQAYGGACAS